jgi:hypothetical protein
MERLLPIATTNVDVMYAETSTANTSATIEQRQPVGQRHDSTMMMHAAEWSSPPPG